MKRIALLAALIGLLTGCVWPQGVEAQIAAQSPASVNHPPPGAALADAVSIITGVAISPLLGASAVGAWKYFQAPPAARNNLPWFAQPWFWMTGLVVVGICALKDVLGLAIPAVFKKPFDVLETAQHKVSGLILVGAFVPLVASVFTSTGNAVPASLNTAFSGHGFVAAIDPGWFYNSLAIPVLIVTFFIVFLASNAINILILLSPFPVLDFALKLFRLSVLASIVVAAFVNPWLGALWSLVIIFLASLIAGWSFRLSHFGLTFIWDVATRHSRRFKPDASANTMFLGRKIAGVPIRTYGKLLLDAQGKLLFVYHPWLILPKRVLALPDATYAVGEGLLYSEIMKIEKGQPRTALLLPPRYRSHEREIAAIYGMAGVRDAGLRAAFAWLKEWLGFRQHPPVIAVQAQA